MGIKSIKIVNLLSFDELIINDFTDINCIIGQNNVGKSNLLKLIRYFYIKLDGKSALPPNLHSAYSSFGSITVIYDTTRIKKIVTSSKNNSNYFKHIYNTLFKGEPKGWVKFFFVKKIEELSTYHLTLKIYANDSIEWSIKDKKVRDVLNFLYPFFEVETRHIDLYDWEKLWYIISKLKSFNVNKLDHDDVIEFFDERISENSKSYSDYIEKIDGIIDITKYSYREKVLNYIKVGLKGHTFMISGEELTFQSDGTNSYKYIELLLTLLITLTRREYITPTIYIDEPETGLHPKRNEELIYRLYEVYHSFKKTKDSKEIGRYKTPYPKILFSTHSPNILKFVIKLFDSNQQVLHFSKERNGSTKVSIMNSQYKDKRFLNIFSDNEARLFFSEFILFVEGATELEVFGNLKLSEAFPALKKIDVYQNNDVTLKHANPSYANLSIPYLILYDADKLIIFDVDSQKISYKKNSVNLDKIYTRVKRSYFGSKQYNQKIIIKELIYNGNTTYTSDVNHVRFDGCSLSDHIYSINKNILNPNNVMITSTTIEGSLINENNMYLFNKWLISEVVNNFNVKNHNDMSKFIGVYKHMYDRGDEIEKIFKGLLSLDVQGGGMSIQQVKFINVVKYKYLNKVKRELKNHCVNEANLLNVYRLLFNGKTDTLIGIDNETYKHISATFKSIVKIARKNHLSQLEPIMGKTGGWVSRFIDFSIDSIKKDFKGEEFSDEFKSLFPEIYGIIHIASSSIE